MVERISRGIHSRTILPFSLSSEGNDTFTPAFGSLGVPPEQEVSRMAKEAAFSRRRNDNPRSKIHLQERDGEKKETFSLSLRKRCGFETSADKELTSEGRRGKGVRKKAGKRK